MRIFAYTFQSHARIMQQVSGVFPYLCPPWRTNTLITYKFTNRDLLLFTFHGLANQPYWYSDTWETALSVEDVRHSNCKGAVVFSGSCYTIESGFCSAFFEAGAEAVIAGPGRNYFIPGRRNVPVPEYPFGGAGKVGGFDRLAYYFRIIYNIHRDVKAALDLAKIRFKMLKPSKITKDVLDFNVYTPCHR